MWQLYVIVDSAAIGKRRAVDVAAAAIQGGADAIQLRDKQGTDTVVEKTAHALLSITRPARVPLILNDRVDVACRVGTDGIHVGQDDLALAQVRLRAGKGMILGKSTHSLKQAIDAEKEGASYIGFGPLFATPTKPTYESIGLASFPEVSRQVKVPIVCIGGIDADNLDAVLSAGAQCVAVVRAVCAAKEPETAVRTLKSRIAQFNRERPGFRL